MTSVSSCLPRISIDEISSSSHQNILVLCKFEIEKRNLLVRIKDNKNRATAKEMGRTSEGQKWLAEALGERQQTWLSLQGPSVLLGASQGP